MFASYKPRRRQSLRETQTLVLAKRFAICKLGGMETGPVIQQLRADLKMTQEQFAAALGLANKASVSILEKGGPCSLRVSLELERLSEGKIDAATLNDDVRRAREAAAA